jgi:hypothetical protein
LSRARPEEGPSCVSNRAPSDRSLISLLEENRKMEKFVELSISKIFFFNFIAIIITKNHIYYPYTLKATLNTLKRLPKST